MSLSLLQNSFRRFLQVSLDVHVRFYVVKVLAQCYDSVSCKPSAAFPCKSEAKKLSCDRCVLVLVGVACVGMAVAVATIMPRVSAFHKCNFHCHHDIVVMPALLSCACVL